jgi:hypothetical protein
VITVKNCYIYMGIHTETENQKGFSNTNAAKSISKMEKVSILKEQHTILEKELENLKRIQKIKIIPSGIPTLLLSVMTICGSIAIAVLNPPIYLIPASLFFLGGIKKGYQSGCNIIGDYKHNTKLQNKHLHIKTVEKQIKIAEKERNNLFKRMCEVGIDYKDKLLPGTRFNAEEYIFTGTKPQIKEKLD